MSLGSDEYEFCYNWYSWTWLRSMSEYSDERKTEWPKNRTGGFVVMKSYCSLFKVVVFWGNESLLKSTSFFIIGTLEEDLHQEKNTSQRSWN